MRVTFGRDAGAGALRSASPGMPSTYKERGHEAWALRLLGEIAARPDGGEVEQAEAHYDQARVLAETLGMRPLVAHCHRELGTLHRRIGHHAKAQPHQDIATRMYQSMNMTLWQARHAAARRPTR